MNRSRYPEYKKPTITAATTKTTTTTTNIDPGRAC